MFCMRQKANDLAIILGVIYLSFALSLFSPIYLLFSKKGLLFGSEILRGVLSNTNIRILTPPKNWGLPLTPCTIRILGVL